MGVSKKKIVGIVAVVIVAVAILGYFYDLNGKSMNFMDSEVRVVVSGSMDGEPREQYEIETIPVGSLVVIQKVPSGLEESYRFYSSLEVGDVVTFHFKHPMNHEDMVVTHRIVDIQNMGGDIKFTMAGDSIRDDPTNTSEQVVYASSGDMIGKVVGVSPLLGSFVIFLSSAEGKAMLIGVFAAVIALIWIAPIIYRHFTNKECD